MTMIDDRFDDFCVYSVFNTVLLCLTLSTMSKLYQKTVICFENGFSLLETQNDINFGLVKTCVKP